MSPPFGSAASGVTEWIQFGDRPISQRRISAALRGADPSFNPTSNAYVRIYVGRLRSLLARSYAGAGAADPLIFDVTRGSYQLSIKRNPAVEGPRAASGVVADPGRTAAIVLLTELTAHGDLAGLQADVPRVMAGSLIGTNGIVATGPIPRQSLVKPICESDLVQRSAADFVLDGEIRSVCNAASRTIEVVLELFSIRSRTHVRSISCEEPIFEHDLPEAADTLATRLVVLLEQALGRSASAI